MIENRREFIKKYGDVKVKFKCYYKYMFTFIGTTHEGDEILVDVGGGDIYRVEVNAEEISIIELYPDCGIVRREGEVIAMF